MVMAWHLQNSPRKVLLALCHELKIDRVHFADKAPEAPWNGKLVGITSARGFWYWFTDFGRENPFVKVEDLQAQVKDCPAFLYARDSDTRDKKIRDALGLDQRCVNKKIRMEFGRGRGGTDGVHYGVIYKYDSETHMHHVRFDNSDDEDHCLLAPHYSWRFALPGPCLCTGFSCRRHGAD